MRFKLVVACCGDLHFEEFDTYSEARLALDSWVSLVGSLMTSASIADSLTGNSCIWR